MTSSTTLKKTEKRRDGIIDETLRLLRSKASGEVEQAEALQAVTSRGMARGLDRVFGEQGSEVENG